MRDLQAAIRARLDNYGIELTAHDIAQITDVVDLWLRQQMPGFTQVNELLAAYRWEVRRRKGLQAANDTLRGRVRRLAKERTTTYSAIRRALNESEERGWKA